MGERQRVSSRVSLQMAKLAVAIAIVIVAMVASSPVDDFPPLEFVVRRSVEDDVSLQPEQVFKDIALSLDVVPQKEILHPLRKLADTQGRPDWMPGHSHKHHQESSGVDGEQDSRPHKRHHHHKEYSEDEFHDRTPYFPLGRCERQCMEMPEAADEDEGIGKPSRSGCERACEQGFWAP